MKLSSEEIVELNEEFKDLINYESEDPCEQIDPLTYIAPDDDTCLHVAALRGSARAVELLIKAGVDVNHQGDMGETPLHIAIRKHHTSIINALIKAGARTDIVSEFNVSAKQLSKNEGIPLG